MRDKEESVDPALVSGDGKDPEVHMSDFVFETRRVTAEKAAGFRPLSFLSSERKDMQRGTPSQELAEGLVDMHLKNDGDSGESLTQEVSEAISTTFDLPDSDTVLEDNIARGLQHLNNHNMSEAGGRAAPGFDKAVTQISSYDDLPIDWSLKSRVTLTSKSSFSWMERSFGSQEVRVAGLGKFQGAGVRTFGRSDSLKNRSKRRRWSERGDASISQEEGAEMMSALYYYKMPEDTLPTSLQTTFKDISTKMDKDKILFESGEDSAGPSNASSDSHSLLYRGGVSEPSQTTEQATKKEIERQSRKFVQHRISRWNDALLHLYFQVRKRQMPFCYIVADKLVCLLLAPRIGGRPDRPGAVISPASPTLLMELKRMKAKFSVTKGYGHSSNHSIVIVEMHRNVQLVIEMLMNGLSTCKDVPRLVAPSAFPNATIANLELREMKNVHLRSVDRRRSEEKELLATSRIQLSGDVLPGVLQRLVSVIRRTSPLAQFDFEMVTNPYTSLFNVACSSQVAVRPSPSPPNASALSPTLSGVRPALILSPKPGPRNPVCLPLSVRPGGGVGMSGGGLARTERPQRPRSAAGLRRSSSFNLTAGAAWRRGHKKRPKPEQPEEEEEMDAQQQHATRGGEEGRSVGEDDSTELDREGLEDLGAAAAGAAELPMHSRSEKTLFSVDRGALSQSPPPGAKALTEDGVSFVDLVAYDQKQRDSSFGGQMATPGSLLRHEGAGEPVDVVSMPVPGSGEAGMCMSPPAQLLLPEGLVSLTPSTPTTGGNAVFGLGGARREAGAAAGESMLFAEKRGSLYAAGAGGVGFGLFSYGTPLKEKIQSGYFKGGKFSVG